MMKSMNDIIKEYSEQLRAILSDLFGMVNDIEEMMKDEKED